MFTGHYEYAYFSLIILYALAWSYFYWKNKGTRKEMLTVSLMCMPLGVTMPLYLDCCRAVYLLPITKGLGVEDFLWAFFVSGIGAVIYDFFAKKILYKDSKRSHSKASMILSLAMLLSVSTGILFVATQYFNISSYIVSFVGFIFLTVMIFIQRRDLIVTSLVSALMLGVLTFINYIILLHYVFPGATDVFWVSGHMTGIRIMSVPIEEILYSFLWGGAISILYEFITGRAKRNKRK